MREAPNDKIGSSSSLPTLPMPLLPSRHYVSEHTQFIRELLEKKPQLEADQRIGRAIWWDKLPWIAAASRRRGTFTAAVDGHLWLTSIARDTRRRAPRYRSRTLP